MCIIIIYIYIMCLSQAKKHFTCSLHPIVKCFSILREKFCSQLLRDHVISSIYLTDTTEIYFQGVFVGKSSGRVYVCQECDDYQEQCIVCIAYSLEHFLVRGPQKLLEYNKPQCLFENCYGCFDPFIKDRVLSSIGWQSIIMTQFKDNYFRLL